jgi:hypothetical protein
LRHLLQEFDFASMTDAFRAYASDENKQQADGDSATIDAIGSDHVSIQLSTTS